MYVPADDLTDPAPATTFAHLDATTVLSRSIAELGIYPAVDPLDSTSRMLSPIILGQEHYNIARGVQKVLQDYKNLQVSWGAQTLGASVATSYMLMLHVGVAPLMTSISSMLQVLHPDSLHIFCNVHHVVCQALQMADVALAHAAHRISLPSWVWMS